MTVTDCNDCLGDNLSMLKKNKENEQIIELRILDIQAFSSSLYINVLNLHSKCC